MTSYAPLRKQVRIPLGTSLASIGGVAAGVTAVTDFVCLGAYAPVAVVALMVAPFTDMAIQQGVAVAWIDPEKGYVKELPMTSLAYMASADWIKANRETARKVFIALARGARDYCQAYHHGPNRAEVIQILLKNGIGKDFKQLDEMDWQARDPNGIVNQASIVDLLRVFKKDGMIEKDPPLDKLVDNSFSTEIEKALGPFELINKASKLEGCR